MSNEVARGLHQGDREDALAMLREWHQDVPSGVLPRFDMLVLAAEEVQPVPRARLSAPALRVPLRDEEVPLSLGQRRLVASAARKVARAVQRHQRVLVTCAMGLNRSGLISGLALRALGADGRQAVTLVRRARGPLALSNQVFEDLVLSMGRDELAL